MAEDATRSLRDELPAHRAFVHRLARSLVRDAARADDLAQDVQLAALRNEGSIGAALAPWLARVARNFARRGWRDAARRRSRERAAAKPETLPGADDSAARLEVQRALLDALAVLEPPVRHALIRHYFDGWTSARIARETGEPAATVRWRLQRGLAELRERLERSSGRDGVQWRLALLPLCAKPAPWVALGDSLRPLAGAVTLQGALTMKAASLALAAAGIAATVGVGALWIVEREATPLALSAGDPAPSAAELPREPARELAEPAPPEPSQRRAIAPELETARRAEAPAPAPPPTAAIDGRCVDVDLVSIAGARVTRLGEDEGSVLSAGDGRFELARAADRAQPATLRVEAAGFATRFLEIHLPAREPVHLGDVVLEPGGSVRGRVIGPLGAPFAGARVSVSTPDLWGSLEEARVQGPRGTPLVEGVSGADGRFVVAGVGEGPRRTWAVADGMRYAVTPPIEVRAHETGDEIELRLEPIQRDDRISGVVLSPEAEPVPDASIIGFERTARSATSFGIVADAAGRFELQAKVNHVYDLEVSDPEDRWSTVELEGVAPGTHALEIRFPSPRWIDVDVAAQDGTPIEDFELVADGEDMRTVRMFGRSASGPHADGRARLRVPTVPFWVRVDARGFAPAEKGPFLPDQVPGALGFELVPEPGLRGRVLADGRPIGGAKVALFGSDPSWRIQHSGYPALQNPRPDDQTTTDGEGRFTLRVRRAGSFVVRAEADGWAATDTERLALDPRTGLDGFELELGRGGALEGHVLVAAGRDPSGVIVVVNRGDAFPRSVRSDERGFFRFEGLTSGPWELARGTIDVDARAGTSFSGARVPTVIPFNCSVQDGETTVWDLDLRAFEPCRLAGVLHVNGTSAKDWSVTAWPGASEAMVGTPPATGTAADGSFAFTLDEPGPVRLSFAPPAELGGAGRLDVVTELRPGANDWRGDFAMGRLSGRCLSPLEAGEESLFYNTAAGVTPSCWLPIRPGADGRFVLPFVPAGKGSVRRLKELDGEWTTLVETEIQAGVERTLDVP